MQRKLLAFAMAVAPLMTPSCTGQGLMSVPSQRTHHASSQTKEPTRTISPDGLSYTYNGFPTGSESTRLWFVDLSYPFEANNIDHFHFNFDTGGLNRWDKDPPSSDSMWQKDRIAIESSDNPNERTNFHESELFKKDAAQSPGTRHENEVGKSEDGEDFDFVRLDDPANFDNLCTYMEKSSGKFNFYIFTGGRDAQTVNAGQAIVTVYFKTPVCVPGK